MAIPDFVLELRAQVGTIPLWLSGVTAVIVHPATGELLLIRRSDCGEWAPVTGIIDPGEQPAVAAAREALEEAGVRVRIVRLARVGVTGEVRYDNGDRARYLDLTFLGTWESGDPHPTDGEALEVAWFAPDALPPLSADFTERITAALSGELAARFETR